MRFSLLCLLSVVWSFILVGCGPSRPELGTVTGQVTFDGKLVPEGTVRFFPAYGRPARGVLDAQGRYELTTFETGDGALVGTHEVSIEACTVEGGAPKFSSMEEEIAYYSDRSREPARPARIKWIVPERFAHAKSSNLSATVQSGANEIDFELK